MEKCTECGGTGKIELLTSSKPCPKCSPQSPVNDRAFQGITGEFKYTITTFVGGGTVEAKPHTPFTLQFCAEIEKRRKIMAKNSDHASEIESFVDGMPEADRRELMRAFATGEQEYVRGGWTIGHGNATGYATDALMRTIKIAEINQSFSVPTNWDALEIDKEVIRRFGKQFNWFGEEAA